MTHSDDIGEYWHRAVLAYEEMQGRDPSWCGTVARRLEWPEERVLQFVSGSRPLDWREVILFTWLHREEMYG